MIIGEFNQKGELIFEIGLIRANETLISVDAILDTGFTGWLIVNKQDAIELGWKHERKTKTVQTADGQTILNIYEGIIPIDGEEFIIPVLAGSRVKDILLGVRWLQFKRLIADYLGGVLTLD